MGKLFFTLYRIAIYFIAPLIILRYFYKGLLDKSYRRRAKERFGFISVQKESSLIWIHAVSVGEVNAALPLVNSILETQNNSVLFTCVTPTGSDQIKKSLGDRVQHVYAPIDIGWVVNRFYSRIKPKMLIVLETEIWPNLIFRAHRKKVPVSFVNLRISDRTYHSALRWKAFCQYILNDVNVFGTQSELDSERIIQLGADSANVYRTGNLKFDANVPKDLISTGAELRKFWGGQNRPTVIFGSTHNSEEEKFMTIYPELKKVYPQLVFVIVPRHPERFDSVYQTISETGYSVIRRSNWEQSNFDSVEVILVDTMGELMTFYAASDLAIVGGSFVSAGGHNVLEPIQTEIPVLFGPDMSNFREISTLVITTRAGKQVENWEDCKSVIDQFLSDSELYESTVQYGQQLLNRNRGALKNTIELLQLT